MKKRWTERDIDTLVSMRDQSRMSWENIAFILHRTPQSCQGRYMRGSKWNEGELERLIPAVRETPYSMKEISHYVATKTAHQCARKLAQIDAKKRRVTPEEVAELGRLGWKECARRYPQRSPDSWCQMHYRYKNNHV